VEDEASDPPKKRYLSWTESQDIEERLQITLPRASEDIVEPQPVLW
jgi:hypothetical protein